jgi:alpha-mannosidase
VDLLLDSDIELLIMAINLHLSGTPMPRPADDGGRDGRQSDIARTADPTLLAWPLNNYWETNFRASQPGWIELRYAFVSHGPFDPVRAALEGQRELDPPLTHPVLEEATSRQGRFLDVQGDGVVINHVKPADDGQGIIVRLVNLGQQRTTARIAWPGHPAIKAWRCSTLEENRTELACESGAAVCERMPRQIATVRITEEQQRSSE